MNALATDHASRLAHLITTIPALAGVTDCLYTGKVSSINGTHVTAESLIIDCPSASARRTS